MVTKKEMMKGSCLVTSTCQDIYHRKGNQTLWRPTVTGKIAVKNMRLRMNWSRYVLSGEEC